MAGLDLTAVRFNFMDVAHGIGPFRVQIVAKHPDRSRINAMRQCQKNKPDSRASEGGHDNEGIPNNFYTL